MSKEIHDHTKTVGKLHAYIRTCVKTGLLTVGATILVGAQASTADVTTLAHGKALLLGSTGFDDRSWVMHTRSSSTNNGPALIIEQPDGSVVIRSMMGQKMLPIGTIVGKGNFSSLSALEVSGGQLFGFAPGLVVRALNGSIAPLSMALQMRQTQIGSEATSGAALHVAYRIDDQGLVDRLWLLTPTEFEALDRWFRQRRP